MANVRTVIKQKIVQFLNMFRKTETIEASKEKWNKLAGENARYYVLTNQGENIQEKEFRTAGKKDFEDLILKDVVLKEKLSPFQEKRVLEIGCGIGRISEFFADNFKSVTGLDISEEMIAQAKQRLAAKKNASFVAGDGTHYAFPDNSFDMVFSFIVFQHMPDEMVVQKNIAEIARVLVPGGIAKIQLRGIPVEKTNWFYGPSFDHDKAMNLISGLPVSMIREEGQGEKYYWITFQKK